MKIALVHDYIKEYGGAEKVLETLHEIFPKAPVFTSVYLPQFLGPHKERFENWDIRTSWLQNIPFKEKLISPFRIISPFVFKSFDLSGFDLVIVSQTGAYFPNCIRCHPEGAERLKNPQQDRKTVGILRSPLVTQNDKRRRQIHITYCHTPPRYLYGYKTARQWKNNMVLRILGEVANHFLRIVDFNASRNVDYFIANSQEVASRIKKFYRRKSMVIYPPVNNSKFKIQNSKSQFKTQKFQYYLTGGRLARAKGTDIIIDAFVKLDKPLKVFGKGFAGFEQELKVQSSKFKVNNIEFLGEVSDEEKFELMRNAKAYIFASFDEDFGITPVEAMSVGTPVIAYKSGGVKETVIDGKIGILYDENTSCSITEAVKKFEKTKFDSNECIKQAQKFSEEKFKREFLKFLKTNIGSFG
ncbi:MAG: hypothetical protein A2905_03425 [Candidatus Levybacteria bacterium RIFCSPLOWO2_01_FULL_36_10]|nr:MAG: hypothetical protein A2905_03425 [Candidatus Levybacteria bacterium RIFCSPLOWO2_01_FULL_36_10]